MYSPQPKTFLPPDDENATIWRYMDFTKFVSLLDAKCLHFTRPDQFSDPFEGAVPEQVRLNLEESARRLNYPPGFKALANYEKIRRLTCVNCWHVNEHESEAMWKLYLKSDEGIAIRSTHSRLIQSFDDSKDIAICVGMVQYIDYQSQSFHDGNLFAGLMTKRKSFEHERELRALAYGIYWEEDKEKGSLATGFSGQRIAEHGLDIPVRLDVLVEAVYVSPVRQPWFRALVESVTERYGITVPVHRSHLSSDPIW